MWSHLFIFLNLFRYIYSFLEFVLSTAKYKNSNWIVNFLIVLAPQQYKYNINQYLDLIRLSTNVDIILNGYTQLNKNIMNKILFAFSLIIITYMSSVEMHLELFSFFLFFFYEFRNALWEIYVWIYFIINNTYISSG